MPNLLGLALRNRRAGRHTLAWAIPALDAPENFVLTSAAFAPGQPIPERYRGRLRAPNIAPPLAWTAPPVGTVGLVLIVQDPDVPFGSAALHALTIGIEPGLSALPEGALAQPSPVPGIRHGKGALGRRGWAGPLPVRSHGPHSYVFQLFALDQRLEVPEAFALADVTSAMAGHVLGRAVLEGTYEIR
jgi:Raf kinase inhibitor-like YbhB/YbcL family protein